MALRRVANGERETVHQLARKKWRSSGLSDREAKKLKLTALRADQTKALGPNFHEAASLHIPYFDLRGRSTSFFRVRYLEPLPGFAGQVRKPDRFTQEIRALNEVYLPPLFTEPWEGISQNGNLTLYITEGELKAAAGCAAGLPTIGLGGVDVWRAAKRGITFLPILEKFLWKNRQVRIIYDSDLANNPDVIRAQRALAGELLARGAVVEIINIPPAEDGKKQGLDDFLVAEGPDELEKLVETGVEFPESDALWGMNEEVLLIPKSGLVVERSTGDLIEVERFRRVVYANRHYQEAQTVGKGKSSRTVLIKKPLAPKWLEWEQRAQMDKIVYEPNQPQEHEGSWNVWPGWACQPKRGDVGPFLWLMDFLFQDQEKIKKWFQRWLAYPFQYPGTKMFTAPLLWSREQRVGKTSVAYAMQAIYGDNFVEIKSKDLSGSFNYWAKNRQFVYGDEINSKETRIDADWLKGMMTQSQITLKEKFLPERVMRDCMNYYFNSNHPDALFMDDRDGRYMVHEVRGLPAEDTKYEKFYKWLNNGGAPHLFQYLLDLDLGDFNPKARAPDTPGKLSMIQMGKGQAAYWVQLLHEDRISALKSLGPGIGATCDLYTPTQLHRAFDPEGRSRTDVGGLGRALSAGGFRQLNYSIPIRTSLGLQRIYAVHNEIDWEQATTAEIVEHFDKFWAPGEKRLT